MTELTHEEIAARAGFPEETPEVVEEPKEEAEEVEPKEEPTTEAESKGEEPEEEPKGTEEPSEEEEPKEPKEPVKEPKPEERQQRTVPYGKLKQERQKTKVLEDKISEIGSRFEKLESLITNLASGKKVEEDPIIKASKELAEQTGVDENLISGILSKAKELIGGKELPKEVEEKLAKFDEILENTKKEKQILADSENFNSEWEEFVPELKKQYPNASDSMLKEAKAKLDDFAHSKEHHTHELDYILYKEKNTFDNLLKIAPKGKSGEKGRQITREEYNEDDDNVSIENLTPEVMKRRDAAKISRNDRKSDITFLS